MDSIDRYRGALLGLAVGDALGGPLAFLSKEQIRIKHGDVTGMIGGGWLGLRPGETTDAIELALRLAESLIDKGTFDRLDVAIRYVEAYEKRPTGLDNITRAALAAIASGTKVDEAAREAAELTGDDGVTNGTLGRSVPIALFFARDADALVASTLAEAAVTHPPGSARAGAAVLNLFLSHILAGVSGYDELFDSVERTVAERPEDLQAVLGKVRDHDEADLRVTGGLVETLELALYHFYWGDSLRDAVLRGIRSGGPTATTGALIGALAGAFHGHEAIPAEWLRALEGRSRIERLAESLHAGAPEAA